MTTQDAYLSPLRLVRCTNIRCGYQGQEPRVVSLLSLGKGVYQAGPLLCQCNYELKDVTRGE